MGVKSWPPDMKAYLRGLCVEGLASQWRSAALFPACPIHMREVIEEFQRRGIAMTPVLDDYQRRLVEEERERRQRNLHPSAP